MSQNTKSLVEGSLESATAVVAIFAHTVLVEKFRLGAFGWLSLLLALVAAFGVWMVFRWRINTWLKSRERDCNIEGSCRAVIRTGSEVTPVGVSVLNILRDKKGLRVQGRSIELLDTEGKTFHRGRWESTKVAYSESDLTLMYTFVSHTNNTIGLCTYSFERHGAAGLPPLAYSGSFYGGNDQTKGFWVTGQRSDSHINLSDDRDLEGWARETWRDLALGL